MNSMQRWTLLVALLDRLKAAGSWCGETHLQKSVYLAQELLGVPFEYEFVLYRYGPYSFDLSDDISSMRANGVLDLALMPPYGPQIVPGEGSEQLRTRYPRTIQRYESRLEFVARTLGSMHVDELERFSTALYATLRLGQNAGVLRRAEFVSERKPHIELEQAIDSVHEVDAVQGSVSQLISAIP